MEVRLFLIGDAGAPAPKGEPVLSALSRQLAADTSRSLVVFLGDNAYPRGMADSSGPKRAEQERRLAAQLDVVLTNHASGIVVPGNHDWAKHSRGGLIAVQRESAFVTSHARRFADSVGRETGRRKDSLVFRPSAGCPGPDVLDVTRHLRVVALDTQWWLHPHARRDSSCRAGSPHAVEEALAEAVGSAGERRVVVVGHHPLESGSEHGGFYDWKRHLFPLTALDRRLLIPLPLIGSLYPLNRMQGVSPQDMMSPRYCRMRAVFDSAFAEHPPLIYAAGHDHNLQVFQGGSARYTLVSGAGIYKHTNSVTTRPNTLLALRASGFMRLDIYRPDGKARLSVWVVDGAGEAKEVYALWLDQSAPLSATAKPICHPAIPPTSLAKRALLGQPQAGISR